MRRDSKPVFVNFTAAWCITCKVNERVVLQSDALTELFDAHGVTYIVGDWTRQDPEITAVLQAHQRAGVPLYLYFPPKPGEPAVVLPQVLTLELIERTLTEHAGTVAANRS